jgi:hypothetical protein
MKINISDPVEIPGVWRWEGIALAVLFGLGLILWPFMSFGVIFMFDSPIQNRADLVGRYTVAYFIWGYPVTYIVTLLAYYLLRRFGVWRVASCLAWGLPVAIYFILSAYLTWQGQPANAGRVRLLFRTDHGALLARCREVMANRHNFKTFDDGGWDGINPNDPNIPAEIVALHPRSVSVSKDGDCLVLVLHAEIDYYSVIALSENAPASSTNGLPPDLRLIPGLWYHDDQLGYQLTDRAAYLAKLRALKPADAPTPKW